jgi:hypothetical protein
MASRKARTAVEVRGGCEDDGEVASVAGALRCERDALGGSSVDLERDDVEVEG